MKCIKCKETYDDDFKFCPYCGEKKPEPKICPFCRLEPKIEFSFCPQCGRRLISKSKWKEITDLVEKMSLYEMHEEYEEAIECIDQLIELISTSENLSSENLQKNKIIYLENLKRYEEAVEYCDKLIELEPENILYWEEKKRCFNRLGRHEEAKKCANKLIELRRAL